MSFLSVLQSSTAIAQQAAPFVTAVNPLAGSVMSSALSLIIAAEQKFTQPKSGPQKKEWVQQGIAVGIPLIEAILHAKGIDVKVDANAVGDLIDSLVATLNAAQKVQESFSISTPKVLNA